MKKFVYTSVLIVGWVGILLNSASAEPQPTPSPAAAVPSAEQPKPSESSTKEKLKAARRTEETATVKSPADINRRGMQPGDGASFE